MISAHPAKGRGMDTRYPSIFETISDMLSAILGDLRTGARITESTVFHSDLGMSDIDILALLGRLQARFGHIDLDLFLTEWEEGSLHRLTVGELVGHLARLLDTSRPAPEQATDEAAGPAAEPATYRHAIIISNGRSGSTMLSDLVAEQNETLSVQEFFSSIGVIEQPPGSDDDVTSGAEYWAALSSPRPDEGVLGRIGRLPQEVRYPSDGRWAGKPGQLPRILRITLPAITADPDDLFDTLASRVPGFPRQSRIAHHRAFLDLLTSLTGRSRWVERSGVSTAITGRLLRMFPTAKIVYLHRNPTDTARSMSKHPSFQLGQLRTECFGRYGFDPLTIEPDQVIPEQARQYLPDQLTPEVLQKHGGDHRRHLWQCAILDGRCEQTLADTPPQHLLRLQYESIVDDPAHELGRLGRFLEFDDWEDWADRTSKRVRKPS